MPSEHNSSPLISFKKSLAIKGEVTVPGDKSISHRALIFSTIASGTSTITGILEGEDVLKTAAALEKMGAQIKRLENQIWQIKGVGINGLQEPNDVLDMGNSGTAARLLMGLVAPFNFKTFFTGDSSLRKRPMKRVFDPLKEMGVKVIAREENLLPSVIIGSKLTPINYEMKTASAQVKSAIMLSALNIFGTTTIIEPEKCRDHTEIMMRYLGLDIEVEDIEIAGKNVNKITINGKKDFEAKDLHVPGDISSAAFLIVAALIIPESKIKINNVGINPLRDGILKTLEEMGGKIEFHNQRIVGGEKVADIVASYSELSGVNVPSSRTPSMIDEYPILAIAAAHAKGTTKMNGLAELKVKESDRLKAIADGLIACGVKVKVGNDNLEVFGGIEEKNKIAEIATYMDHRIAMSFLIMGLTLKNGVKIDDSEMIKTSFPTFLELFRKFGAEFKNSI